MRNPGKHQYYDPFVEGENVEEVQLQIRGIAVGEPGLYILFEDFLSAIGSYAFAADDPNKQRTIYELISWLEQTFIPGEEGNRANEGYDDVVVLQNQDGRGKIVSTIDDATRVELYPDADRKWHARLVDKNGLVIGRVNNGSFDRNWVEKDVAEKYPDLEIVQLESEDEDSTWTHKGPSKRLWGR